MYISDIFVLCHIYKIRFSHLFKLAIYHSGQFIKTKVILKLFFLLFFFLKGSFKSHSKEVAREKNAIKKAIGDKGDCTESGRNYSTDEKASRVVLQHNPANPCMGRADRNGSLAYKLAREQ